MLPNPDGTLSYILLRCRKLVDVGGDALAEPLTTIDGETADSTEARVILSGAVRAAKLLSAYLEKHWEFGVDEAWPKEETCPD
jgi:hypothetical protein